jgi:hypothetical protein
MPHSESAMRHLTVSACTMGERTWGAPQRHAAWLQGLTAQRGPGAGPGRTRGRGGTARSCRLLALRATVDSTMEQPAIIVTRIK